MVQPPCARHDSWSFSPHAAFPRRSSAVAEQVMRRCNSRVRADDRVRRMLGFGADDRGSGRANAFATTGTRSPPARTVRHGRVPRRHGGRAGNEVLPLLPAKRGRGPGGGGPPPVQDLRWRARSVSPPPGCFGGGREERAGGGACRKSATGHDRGPPPLPAQFATEGPDGVERCRTWCLSRRRDRGGDLVRRNHTPAADIPRPSPPGSSPAAGRMHGFRPWGAAGRGWHTACTDGR